jgi:transposase
MYKKYRVELTATQRDDLRAFVSTGTGPASALAHARMLLKADAAPGAPAWKDAQIADAFDVHVRTVVRVRQTFLRAGLERALQRHKRSGPSPRKVDGAVEAQIVALVCGPAPPGCARWTLRLVRDRVVELVDLELSHETIRRTLKKTNLSLG